MGGWLPLVISICSAGSIVKGEDGLILHILEEERVCAANLHKSGRMMSPKAHSRQVNLRWGQKQRGLAQSGYYLYISEFGGNLKINKLSFVKIANLF